MFRKLLVLSAALFVTAPAFSTSSGVKCDLDNDGNIDRLDLDIILAWRGQRVPPAPWEADVNNDGLISITDVRGCVLRCTIDRCVVL